MFNRLLVPLDGSELSERALSTARQVLGAEGILTLLNIVDMPDVNLVMLYDMSIVPRKDTNEELIANAQRSSRAYLQRIADQMHLPPTIAVNIEVCIGDPTAVIVERAQALHVDAIVMSTHGRSGLSRWMYGSVTQRVLGLMPCPVLIVPGQSAVPVETTQPGAVVNTPF